MLKTSRVLFLLRIGLILCCVTGLSTAAQAQKKRPVRKPAAAKPAAVPAASSALVIKEEAAKVATQIKTLTKFIYLLGSTAQTIEDIDKDPKASADVRRRSDAGKQTLVQTVSSMRTEIIKVEGDFVRNAELRSFRQYIQGASELSTIAEDQASAGQFKNVGKTLLEVVNKLTDTLQYLK
jgi:hypothetical protein